MEALGLYRAQPCDLELRVVTMQRIDGIDTVHQLTVVFVASRTHGPLNSGRAAGAAIGATIIKAKSGRGSIGILTRK